MENLKFTNKNKKCAVDINEMYTFMKDINMTDSKELTPSNLYTSPVRNDNQFVEYANSRRRNTGSRKKV